MSNILLILPLFGLITSSYGQGLLGAAPTFVTEVVDEPGDKSPISTLFELPKDVPGPILISHPIEIPEVDIETEPEDILTDDPDRETEHDPLIDPVPFPEVDPVPVVLPHLPEDPLKPIGLPFPIEIPEDFSGFGSGFGSGLGSGMPILYEKPEFAFHFTAIAFTSGEVLSAAPVDVAEDFVMNSHDFLIKQCAPIANDECLKEHMRMYVCSALQNMVTLREWVGEMRKSSEGCAAAASKEMMGNWMNALSCPETKNIMCTKREMRACADVTADCRVCVCMDGGYTESDWKIIFDMWRMDTFNHHGYRMAIYRTLKEQCTGTSTSTCG